MTVLVRVLRLVFGHPQKYVGLVVLLLKAFALVMWSCELPALWARSELLLKPMIQATILLAAGTGCKLVPSSWLPQQPRSSRQGLSSHLNPQKVSPQKCLADLSDRLTPVRGRYPSNHLMAARQAELLLLFHWMSQTLQAQPSTRAQLQVTTASTYGCRE